LHLFCIYRLLWGTQTPFWTSIGVNLIKILHLTTRVWKLSARESLESLFSILAEREEGRLNNEVRRINNEIKDLAEKRNILEV